MQKNVAGQKIGCQMVSATDGSAFTGSVTVSVCGDAGTQATGSVGSGACTHEGNGYHTYAPAQAETNYDLIAFTFTGTGAVPATVQLSTSMDVNVTKFGGTAGTFASGRPEVNTTHLAGTSQTARDIGASVLLSSGTGTGQVTLTSGRVNADITHINTAAVSTSTAQLGVNVVNFGGSAGTFASGIPAVNATQISGDATAADNAESFFDGTGYAGTNNVIPTVTTTTNLTNKGDGSGFTAIPWNASWDAEVQSECADALTAYDPPTHAELTSELASADDATLAAIAAVDIKIDTIDTVVDAILVDTAEIGVAGAGLTNINLPNQTMDIVGNITGNLSGTVGSVTGAVGSVTGNVGGNVTGSVGSVASGGITAASIATNAIDADALAADAVTEIQSGLATASALSTAQADITTIKGYTDDIGVAGAGLTALASAANLSTAQGNITSILADTNELQTDWANGGRLDLILDARASQTSVDDLPTNAELATALGTADDAVLAAIAALNNLSPADIRTAVGLASANLDTQLADLPTNSELSTALGTADDAVLAAVAALNNLSSAQVQTAATAALNAYDPPTRTEATSDANSILTAIDALPTNAELATALGTADDAVLSAISPVATKVDELHKIQGLDVANPMTATRTSRTAGTIELVITGDGTTTSTATRQ